MCILWQTHQWLTLDEPTCKLLQQYGYLVVLTFNTQQAHILSMISAVTRVASSSGSQRGQKQQRGMRLELAGLWTVHYVTYHVYTILLCSLNPKPPSTHRGSIHGVYMVCLVMLTQFITHPEVPCPWLPCRDQCEVCSGSSPQVRRYKYCLWNSTQCTWSEP